MTESQAVAADARNDPEWQARLQRLLDEAPEYQAFILPGGVKTGGYDRSYINRHLFGDDFRGKSFFDIGSYLGYFCVEALKRGASEAVGIETDPRNIRQARTLAELSGAAPEYICGNFESWDDAGRQFDTVACLNVLHHLFDPVGALQKMMRMTRDRLVLEVAVPKWRDVMRDKINPLRLLNVGAPAIFLGIPRKRGDEAGRTFLFTPGALRIILNVHTQIFEPIETFRSPFKGRVIVEARKRRIRNLVIVTGPTAVGKTTFSKRLSIDAALQQQLGLGSGPWTLLDASKVDSLPRGMNDNIILHYDFLRPSRTGIRSYDRDPTLHLMATAERTTVLTLIAPLSRLRDQIQSGEMGKERTAKQKKRDADLLKKYQTPVFLQDWYSAWGEFCDALARRPQSPLARHALIVNDGAFQPTEFPSWRSVLGANGS